MTFLRLGGIFDLIQVLNILCSRC